MKRKKWSVLSKKELNQRFRAAEERLLKKIKNSTGIGHNPTLLEFLERHKLKKELFFNANSKDINTIRNFMIDEGALFAFNTTSCKNGHTFRDRNGHCIVCNTANITFQLRKHASGYVYIAGSLRFRLMKIGITNNIKSREISLNKDSYAGTDDWQLLYSFYSTRDTGLIENEVISRLSTYRPAYPFSYFKSGKKYSNEVFFCGFKKIISTLNEVIEYYKIKPIQEVEKKNYIHLYQFPNLKKVD